MTVLLLMSRGEGGGGVSILPREEEGRGRKGEGGGKRLVEAISSFSLVRQIEVVHFLSLLSDCLTFFSFFLVAPLLTSSHECACVCVCVKRRRNAGFKRSQVMSCDCMQPCPCLLQHSSRQIQPVIGEFAAPGSDYESQLIPSAYHV